MIPQILLFSAFLAASTLAGWFYAAGNHAGSGFFIACAIIAILEYNRT